MAAVPLETECCIAGGGPAGIMLGFLLARAGVDVVVLEKWPDFFRDFRGDTIHPSTMEVLHEVGLLDAFLQLPHDKTRRLTGYVGGERIALSDFGRLRVECPFIAMVPQWDFLNFLSSEATKYAGFHLAMETAALDLVRDGAQVVGVRASTAGGPSFDIRAKLVVAADGRHSTLRERAALEVQALGAPIDVLWFRLPRNEGAIEQAAGYVEAGQILVVFNRGDYWQCGLIIEKGGFDAIRLRGMEAFRARVARLAPILEGGVGALDDWKAVKLLSVTVDRARRWYRDGLLAIGDAAHAMSPVGGVGINLAIQDAIATSNIVGPTFRGGRPSVAELAAVQRRRELPTRLTQRIQLLVQDRILAPVLATEQPIRAPWALRLLNHVPPLQRIPAQLFGVGFRPEHVAVRAG